MPRSGQLSGKSLQATFDRHLRNAGQFGTVYALVPTGDAQGTPGDDTYPKQGSIVALVQETQKAQDIATQIGAIGSRAAIGYFTSSGLDTSGKPVAAKSLVKHESYWQDGQGQVWLIHNLPNQQSLTGTTIGLSVLLMYEEAPPILGS